MWNPFKRQAKTLDWRMADGVLIVTPAAGLDYGQDLDDFRKLMVEAIARLPVSLLILNCRRLRRINIDGAKALEGAAKLFNAKGGGMIITNLRREMEDVLSMTAMKSPELKVKYLKSEKVAIASLMAY